MFLYGKTLSLKNPLSEMPELTNPQQDANPILETFHGIPIRRYNKVQIRLDPISYKELIQAEVDSKLSQRQILGYSSKPCNCCTGTFVRVLGKDGNEVKIIRGLLSKRIPDGSGTAKKHKFNIDKCQDI